MYEYYLLAQNPKKSLYDELRNELKNKDSAVAYRKLGFILQAFQCKIPPNIASEPPLFLDKRINMRPRINAWQILLN